EKLIAESIPAISQRHHVKALMGSGLVLDRVNFFTLKVMRRRWIPTGARHQDLPAFLKNKKCIVNVQNQDERCFGYAILSAKYPQNENPHRPTKYTPEMWEESGLNQIQYPVELIQLEEIERQINIPFNVFRYYDDEGKARYPLYISKLDPTQETHPIDLLY